jgi:TonB family protein
MSVQRQAVSARLTVLSFVLLFTPSLRAQEAPSFEPAHLVRSTEPEMPPLEPGQEVLVVLTLAVDAHGQVTGVTVVQSGGAACDAAATAAAREFEFSPARLGGKPVATEVEYRTRFIGPRPAPPAPAAAPDHAGSLFGTVTTRPERVLQANVKVILDDGAAETLTDARGRFVLEGLSPGKHTVHLRSSDIVALDQEVMIDPFLPTELRLFVEAKPRYVARVRGRTALQDPIEQTISAEEIRHIAGTQGDTLKAVQNLPGIARPPFNGGLMAVWGSPPGDTRVYADGVFIPTLYHFGGVRSTVNASIVSSLTLFPGGYDVSHGRGLGGVVEMETREPRRDGIHGFAQIDLVDASGLIEAGLGKVLSVSAGFRVSILDFTLPAFYDPGTKFDPKYWDYHLKLHLKLSPRDTLDLFFFGSDDSLDVGIVDPNGGPWHTYAQRTFFHRGLVRYQHRFAGGSTLSISPSVGYDVPYNLDTAVGNGEYTHENAQTGYSVRALYRWNMTRLLRLDAGLDYEGTRYTLDARQNPMGLYREGDTGEFLGYTAPNPAAGVLTDHLILYTNHTAPFLALTIGLFRQRFLIMPQFRLEVMSFYGYPHQRNSFSSAFVLPEPRLATRVRVTSRVALQGSIGIYHQAPDSGDLSAVFGNPKLSPEMGIHYVAGVEVTATTTLHVELQGFYKDLRNLVVRGAGPTDPLLVDGGIGRVYGGELLVRQELWKNFFGWISYTLMRSERRDHPGDAWRVFQYDQTHILTILGSYKLPRGFQVGLRFRYATGNPYTPVARAYYDINSYSFVPVLAAPYSGRLPDFHQLDLRGEKAFTFDHWKLIVYLDIQNVYNATSAEGVTYSYDYKKPYYLNGLPFLPIVGVRGEY